MAVAIDTFNSLTQDTGTGFNDTTLTIGSGSNRLLLALISVASNDLPITSITWGGVALTQVAISANGFDATTYIYALLNPASGANTLNIAWSGSVASGYVGIAFTGVEQSSLAAALTGVQQTQAAFGILTATVSSAVGDIVVASFGAPLVTLSPNNTVLYNFQAASGYSAAANQAAGAVSVVMSATQSGAQPWSECAINVHAAATAAQLRAPYLSKLFSWVSAPAFQPYNLALYAVTAQAPFAQLDWSKQFDLRTLPLDPPTLNINLFTNPIPFGPYDYSEGAYRLFPFRPDTTQPFNPNIYTNPIPFAQYMWTEPVGVGPPPPQAIPYNINVFTNFLPFGPFDWSKPFQVPPERPDPVRGLNINLFTNPIPFAQYMWTDPVVIGPSPPQAIPYNVSLYTVTVVAAPFAQYDWSTTRFQKPQAPDASQSTSVNLLPDPNLFMLVDWSGSASSLRPRAPDQAPYNQSLYTVTAQAAPFIPIDWSKPFFPRVLPLDQVTLNIQLFTNPIPILNYDVSVQVRIKGSSDTTQPYNVNLYGVVVVQVPFVQTDWSKPFVPRPYVTQDKIYNPNLFTNPIPFAQYSWPTPINVPQAQLDRSTRVNPNLFTNPIPFSQSSYPMQRPVRLEVFPLPPYNPNLYTATVAGTTVHIVKFIGNVGHFMIR